MVGTRMLSRAFLWKFLVSRFPVHFTINAFIFLISNFRGQNYTSSKFTGKRNLLVNYGYRQLLTEYVISEMMKY